MSAAFLPRCRHRGTQLAPGQWTCSSPKLVVPGRTVTAEVCRTECPYVDHEPDPRLPLLDRRDHNGPVAQDAAMIRPELLGIAMITAPRPIRTVDHSLAELRRAGFGQTVHVFAEPGAELVERQQAVVLHGNAEPLGAWGNWQQAARRLLELAEAPFLLLCEDDIRLCPDAARALQQALDSLPHATWGYASLYTPWHNLQGHLARRGWQAVALGARARGALGYCFTRDSLRSVLDAAPPDAPHADIAVTVALQRLGRHCYFHVPSLCEHRGGGISTLGHPDMRGNLAVDFHPTRRVDLTRSGDSPPARPPAAPGRLPPGRPAAPGDDPLAGRWPAQPARQPLPARAYRPGRIRLARPSQQVIGAGMHRSGWPYACAALRSLAAPDGILLEDFVEQRFCYTARPAAITEPWVGVFHHPPRMPWFANPRERPGAMIASAAFQQSLPHLRLAIALSEYLGEYLRHVLYVPVVCLKHPGEVPPHRWSPQNLAGRPRRLVQVGWYLRNSRAIYQVPHTAGWVKWRLWNRSKWVEQFDQRVRQHWNRVGGRAEYGQVADVPYLPADRYDQLLSRCVVLLEVFDASATNGLLDAIARQTPVLVNRHPAIAEYLGADYPLYFEHPGQVPDLLDDGRLLAAHHYLQAMDTSWLDGAHFAAGVRRGLEQHT